MFIRDVANAPRAKKNPTLSPAGQQMTPYVAAVKRGPYTLTHPVYSSSSPEIEDTSAKMHSHTFNINVNALKNNYKHHQRAIPAPISKSPLPRIKSRSHLGLNEQRDLYRQHRDRLANIKGKVNTCLPPPKMKSSESNGMELSYMEMLTALYRKSNNTLRTFTKSPDRLAAGRWRNASVAREKERKQQEKNKKYSPGGKLFSPGTTASVHRRDKTAFSYEVPMHVLHRYEDLMNICDVSVLCKLLRPQIYIDVEVLGTSIRGRLAIQLFTEACPQVVLEFMRICSHQSNHCISFTRNFAPIWLEGCISLDPERNLDMNNIEHDFEVLNHGVDAGILSFPCRYVRGNARTALTFTISYKPLSILNGKRIAFGKVRKGLQLLDKIQDATSHLGKNQQLVAIKSCGVL